MVVLRPPALPRSDITIGRPSNNKIATGVRDYVLMMVRERYLDLGQRWRPRSFRKSMASQFRVRRCANG
ncbi:protein of unknown function (plasmid) [Agrobacterium pusense]|uniref:Uncharacterized protein n=1 Tax=Agrobacterium pusense TaxID=648995 RepID=U4QED6_9HYPH|nr:protein of unknown function [Agrobacterium pusense]